MFLAAKLERDADEMPQVRGESTPRVSTRAAQKGGHAFPGAYRAATVRKRRPDGRSQYPAGTWKRMLPSILLVEDCL